MRSTTRGRRCQATRVIEDGGLCFYLYDLTRARSDGRPSTGNGRRQSFRHLPIPRMTNTTSRPAMPPRGADRGGQARALRGSFAGGQVEPATGDFVFGVSEGYLIEDGKITTPVRGATLIGNSLDMLMRIDMIAGDFADRRPGSAARTASGCRSAPARRLCGSRR